ncbi:hypothetical protein HNQ53_003489 [Microbulbifer hydrolyticus]|uniref:Uncharacterized protein n=1 Tax=Microbulbifer hydrolyticus TaxID=48074 RepID=A0AA89PEB4_9GAMM|nr:hypothetical protein [Microbulbifer hydrolyticus]
MQAAPKNGCRLTAKFVRFMCSRFAPITTQKTPNGIRI